MKWRDLTPAVLRNISTDLFDDAHDMEFEREQIQEERGFDAVAATKCVARRLRREAVRREPQPSTFPFEGLIFTYENGWIIRKAGASSDGDALVKAISITDVVVWLSHEMGFPSADIDKALPKLLALRRAARRTAGGGL